MINKKSIIVYTIQIAITLVLYNIFTFLFITYKDVAIEDNQFGLISLIFIFMITVVVILLGYRLALHYVEKNERIIKVNKTLGVSYFKISNYLNYKIAVVLAISFALAIPLSSLLSLFIEYSVDEGEITYIINWLTIFTTFIIMFSMFFLIIRRRVYKDKIKQIKFKYYQPKFFKLIFNIVILILVIIFLVTKHYLLATIGTYILSVTHILGYSLNYISKKTTNPFIYMVNTNLLSRFSYYMKKAFSMVFVLSTALFFIMWVRGEFIGVESYIETNIAYKSDLYLNEFHSKTVLEDTFETYDYEQYQAFKTTIINDDESIRSYQLINTNVDILENICNEDICENISIAPGEIVIHQYIADNLNAKQGDTIKINIEGYEIEGTINYVTKSLLPVTIYVNEGNINELGYNYLRFIEPSIENNKLEILDYSLYRNESLLNKNFRYATFQAQELVEITLLLLSVFSLIHLYDDIKGNIQRNKKTNLTLIDIGISENTIKKSYLTEYLILITAVFAQVFLVTFSMAYLLHSLQKYVILNYRYPFWILGVAYVVFVIISIILNLKFINTKERLTNE